MYSHFSDGAEVEIDLEKLKTSSTVSKEAPQTLRPCATDAYLLFQVSLMTDRGSVTHWKALDEMVGLVFGSWFNP